MEGAYLPTSLNLHKGDDVMLLDQLQLGFELEFAHKAIPGWDMFHIFKDKLAHICPNMQNGSPNMINWYFHSDRTVQTKLNPHEISSPPFPWRKGITIFKECFRIMEDIGARTNNTCGLHVGISFIDTEVNKKLDKVVLCAMANDLKWLERFGREGNSWCTGQWVEFARFKKMDIHIAEKIRRLGSSVDLYSGLRVSKLDYSNPYCEFRIMGNADYHKRWHDVYCATRNFGLAMLYSSVKNVRGRHRVTDRLKELLDNEEA